MKLTHFVPTPTQHNPPPQFIVSTVAFGLGVDIRVAAVINASHPSSIDDENQRAGRAGRQPGTRAKALKLISPERSARQYGFVLSSPEDLQSYNASLLASLDFEGCEQASLGLWPSELLDAHGAQMGSTCGTRCTQCRRGAVDRDQSGYVVDVHALAMTLVGTQGKREVGMVGAMLVRGEGPTFGKIRQAYEEQHGGEVGCVPTRHVPAAILLVIAHGFLMPVAADPSQPKSLNVHFRPSDFFLLQYKYKEAKVEWWLPDI